MQRKCAELGHEKDTKNIIKFSEY